MILKQKTLLFRQESVMILSNVYVKTGT